MSRLLDVMTRRPRPLTNLADEDRVVLFPVAGPFVAGPAALDRRRPRRRLGRRPADARQAAAAEAAAADDAGHATKILPASCFSSGSRGSWPATGPAGGLRCGSAKRVVPLPQKEPPKRPFSVARCRSSARSWRRPRGEPSRRRCRWPLTFDSSCAAPAAGAGLPAARRGACRSFPTSTTRSSTRTSPASGRSWPTRSCGRSRRFPGMAALFREWAAHGAAIPLRLVQPVAALRAPGRAPGRRRISRRLVPSAGVSPPRSSAAAPADAPPQRQGRRDSRSILQDVSQRRFLLVGDSGEHDPEIYGALARRFPQQVAGIFIRAARRPAKFGQRYAGPSAASIPRCVQTLSRRR